MKSLFSLITLLLLIFIISCSTTQQTTQNDNSADSTEVYIFDDVVDDSTNEQPSVSEPMVFEKTKPDSSDREQVPVYIVQIGAYTSKERAEAFVNQNKAKIDHELNIHFSEKVNLYVVQLPPFRTREMAESVRNELWKIDVFKDAFIVP
jgi:cell division protein FtsN